MLFPTHFSPPRARAHTHPPPHPFQNLLFFCCGLCFLLLLLLPISFLRRNTQDQGPPSHRNWFLRRSSECRPDHKVSAALSPCLSLAVSNVTQGMIAAFTQTGPVLPQGADFAAVLGVDLASCGRGLLGPFPGISCSHGLGKDTYKTRDS